MTTGANDTLFRLAGRLVIRGVEPSRMFDVACHEAPVDIKDIFEQLATDEIPEASSAPQIYILPAKKVGRFGRHTQLRFVGQVTLDPDSRPNSPSASSARSILVGATAVAAAAFSLTPYRIKFLKPTPATLYFSPKSTRLTRYEQLKALMRDLLPNS